MGRGEVVENGVMDVRKYCVDLIGGVESFVGQGSSGSSEPCAASSPPPLSSSLEGQLLDDGGPRCRELYPKATVALP